MQDRRRADRTRVHRARWDTRDVTDERNADAARDAVALLQLTLDMEQKGEPPDRAAFDAIVQNGDPARIAAALAGMFVSMLLRLEEVGYVSRVADVLEELRQLYTGEPPSAD